MPCRTGCKTQDHGTFGACARASRLQIDTYALAHGGEEQAKVRELDFYGAVRHDGILPDTTRTADIRRAVDLTNMTGRAYRADQPDKGIGIGEGFWEA